MDKCIDRYAVVSEYVRAAAVRTFAFMEPKIAVLPNGINTETFHPRPDYLEPQSPIGVLFIGRINYDKGPDIAADAVAALRREGIPLALTIAGGTWFYGHNQQDPYLRSLLNKIDAAGGKYLGHVVRNDLPELLRQHDVAFVPSRWNEPSGNVVLENMASGLAVVASNRGGIPEVCGSAGILADPGDLPSMITVLRNLATSPFALAAEKRKSVARAAECTWKKRADELLKIIGGGRGAAPVSTGN